MPRSKKIVSVVVFLNVIVLSYITLEKTEWLESFTLWLNMYELGQMYLLDAARVFQMLAICICSIQLAGFLSEDRLKSKPGRRYWLMLAPFPLAFLYFWAQVFTHNSDVFPRNGIIAMNFVQSFILLGYARMLGFMREHCA